MNIQEQEVKKKKLQEEIAEIDRKIKELQNQTPTQKLAELLHGWIWHNDCDWYYGTWDSTNVACRPRFIALATELERGGLDPEKFKLPPR